MGRHVRARCDVQSLNEDFRYDLVRVRSRDVRNCLHVFTVLANQVHQESGLQATHVLKACDALSSSRIRRLRTKPRVSLVSKVYFGKWPKCSAMDLSTCSSDTRRPSCRLLQRSLLTSRVLCFAVSAFAWFLLEARDPCFAVLRQRCTSQLTTAGKCHCSCVRSVTAQWSQVCPLIGVTAEFLEV